MAMVCRCCAHPRSAEIDAEILADTRAHRSIARDFGVSADSLWRHRQNHLYKALEQAREMRAMMDAEALARRMRELDADVDLARTWAKQAGSTRDLLLSVQQGRGNVETLAKLAAQSDVEQRLAALEAVAHSRTDTGVAGDAGDTS